MALNVAQLGAQMVGAAKAEAGPRWNSIKAAVTIEMQGLARRLAAITRAHVAGVYSQALVNRHLKLALEHVKAMLAMIESMVQALLQAMVNAALNAVKTAVNTAIGFVLL